MRYLLILFTLLFSGIVSPAQAKLFVTTKHSAIQKMFHRGELFLSCTSTRNLFRLIEGEVNVSGCGLVPMTAATRRNDYYDQNNKSHIIVVFYHGGWDYYTFNQPKIRRKKH